jgi:hypothetical protein
MSGPTFWHFDGNSMDDAFAFDIQGRILEEREEERHSWDEFSKRFDTTWAERERLGVTDLSPRGDGSKSIWSRSFSVDDFSLLIPPDAPEIPPDEDTT